jgi:transmembrane sensor
MKHYPNIEVSAQTAATAIERADEWFERLKHSHDPTDRAATVAWLKESPLHVREMLLTMAWDRLLDRMLDPGREIDIEVLMGKKTTRVTEQAKEWSERLKHSHDANDRERYLAWLEESPRHMREMLGVSMRNKLQPRQIASTSRDVVAALDTHVTLQTKTRPRVGWTWLWGLSAAACLAIVLALGWSQFGERSASQQQFATAIGEQRSVGLSDGSIIHLNTQSNVRIAYSDRARDVYLAEGQAIFKVKHDAARAFRVHVDHVIVQAIGTQFDVHRLKDRTTVAVIEGAVQIISNAPDSLDSETLSQLPESTKIRAGEAAVIDADGKLARDTIDVQRTIAWRERTLIFEKSTLAEIATEFNRYNRTPKIRVEGEALRARRYSVVSDADDPQSLLDYLSTDRSLAFDRTGDEVVIRMQSNFSQTRPTIQSRPPDPAGSEK